MAPRETHVRNRLLLWLASGLGFAVLAWAVSNGSLNRLSWGPSARAPEPSFPTRAQVAKDAKAGPSRAFARWLATSGAMGVDGDGDLDSDPNAFPIPAAPPTLAHREHEESDDDEVLFAAMERLERRMAAGMIRARDSVVTLEYKAADGPDGTRRVATGVVINPQGDVLSVRIDRPVRAPGESEADDETGPARITARDAFGRQHLARWIAADPDTGLTLLRIAPRAVRPIRQAAEGPALGSQVFVIGNPFGLGHSVSRGQIAGLDRTLELRSRQINGLIQVQTPLFPGDSGAVVVNFRGQWLGLIRSGLAIPSTENAPTGERGNDLGFAVPADHALWIAAQLRDLGQVDRAYLGVRLESDSALATSPEGAALRDVLPDTPAARGGLRIGDLIVSFDDQPTRTALDLTERLDRTPARKAVRLEIVRGGGAKPERKVVWVETANRPDVPRPAPPTAVVVTPTAAATPAAPTSPKHLRAPVGPTRAEELPLTLPPAVADRLDRLERRLNLLEHPEPSRPEKQASTAQIAP
ncbi:S1C family serine protease [Paludisphaera borealis]|uniref:Periplasmic serine endoprotease DegP n=1 Tax=Paludisphaera borealis TaxID=1387353 RepID=A0A1U7CSS9_9BACT|nr:trypsin-like peptidase domain-containing protein [Paludisphaera borealis]APW61933.1 Periplasmic serine endoprotease DegP [Paludisphaera borealis]